MKSIPMKTLDPEDKAEILDYREVLVTIAKSPDYDRNGQVRGIDISLVRKGVRILKAIEKASDVLLLEDEDYKHLINKAKSFPWAKSSENIVLFMDDLEGATEATQ